MKKIAFKIKLWQTFLFLFCAIICACEKGRKEASLKKEDLSKIPKNSTNIIGKDSSVRKFSFTEIYHRFPFQKKQTKYYFSEENLLDSLTQLTDTEVKTLGLNKLSPKEYQQYDSWYIFGRNESDNYFSLYLFKTIENISLYQVNYTKKDSSLIQDFLLWDSYSGCSEYGYTYSIKRKNEVTSISLDYYQVWTEKPNGTFTGADCKDSTITTYIEQETGKIDSIEQKKFLQRVKRK